MQLATFAAHCPFELEDKVRIILDKEKGKFSEEIYTIYDILAVHSLRKQKVEFAMIVKDSKGNLIEPIEDSSFILEME